MASTRHRLVTLPGRLPRGSGRRRNSKRTNVRTGPTQPNPAQPLCASLSLSDGGDGARQDSQLVRGHGHLQLQESKGRAGPVDNFPVGEDVIWHCNLRVTPFPADLRRHVVDIFDDARQITLVR